MMRKLFCGVIMTGVVVGWSGTAMLAETGGLTTMPTTQPRHVLMVPPGFQTATFDGKTLLFEAADKPWVELAMRGFSPATRPTTMPADLLERLAARRTAIIEAYCRDLAVKDGSSLAKYLDGSLTDELKRLRDFRPPVFYLVSTKDRLRDLLCSGQWQDPGFRYNRIADEVMFRNSVALTLDRPMDDAVLAVLYDPADASAQRQERLLRQVRATEDDIVRANSGQSQFMTQIAIGESIMKDVFLPMNFPKDQQWFVYGSTGILSAEYAAEITGSPKTELLMLLAAEIRQNPIKMRTIDLLEPVEVSQLKPQYVAAYLDAYRRKSISVMLKVMTRSRDKYPQLVESLRQKPCATGTELVARIQQITGVDVSRDVREK